MTATNSVAEKSDEVTPVAVTAFQEDDVALLEKVRRRYDAGALRSLRDKMTQPVYQVLRDRRTIEIVLNPDGELLAERLGESTMRKIGEMNYNQATQLLNEVAGIHRRVINEKEPILECELPLDGSRFTGVVPPVTSGPVFSIRKRASLVWTLDDYVTQMVMTTEERAVISSAVAAKKNILVVGGTGSGKTTLLNAVLEESRQKEPHARLLILEDTPEIQSKAANCVYLNTTLHASMTALLKVTLRLRPDRIIVGEVRDGAAHDLMQAWNTGHPGGVATIHANDCAGGLQRLVNLVSMNPNAPRRIEPDIACAVNIIVCIARHAGSRRIQEIKEVIGWTPNNGFELADAR